MYCIPHSKKTCFATKKLSQNSLTSFCFGDLFHEQKDLYFILKGNKNCLYGLETSTLSLKHVCALELFSLVLFYLHGTREINLNKEIRKKFTGSLSFIIGKLKIPITLLYMDLQKRRKVLTLLPLYSTFPALYFH